MNPLSPQTGHLHSIVVPSARRLAKTIARAGRGVTRRVERDATRS
jgi:hypothetical protein